ncbi:precorrin-2 C(20)-methyltransferase [Desulfuromonas acetoxidans]|uniref:Precorrin-2 C20-methyltransferase n=1 Tax=Desulfuromonas acetoxidans (strain DSM 684 / 11070) TaxID=281689 RepID=Q1JZX1_DESA6|nr:precorrin-2 C(20)-methyltransferase [Desulfuromonas acetoxidans]EAT15771.1 precorrin-2 C20-methyltransferase [Desulfuromonas acetoxidans DSM 684]MBF0646047.1 precorrin-2 C(20)-methyltransferase [Desulfuromonas acetoxidans]NVD25842.1 precorrin-2 C(20)-methyltransferase [Desulfuromonas acetoxidans]NVE16874.1 precorrin-2 C(20)-methyltransferase [Desulfuromonas acetoxidans]
MTKFTATNPQPGHFYAVGIGPGSPDLLTLRAARLVEQCDVILSPQARTATKSLALEAVRPFLSNQEIIVLNYPMERNDQRTRQRWQQLADDVVQRCAHGQSVVQVTLGDPLIFATSSYLLQALADQMPADHLHVVPGISAFQTSASRFGEVLTLQEDRLTLMSATNLDAVAQALDHCETLVLYKAGGCIDSLMELLRQRNLLSQARLVSCGEQGDHELLVDDLSQWTMTPLSYMTTLIVKIGQRGWQENAAS